MRWASGLLYGVSGLIGVVAFGYPFFLPLTGAEQAQAAPILTAVLLMLCLLGVLVEVQSEAVPAKMVATLGVLVAITAVLRFVEVAIPGPGGFSPIFAPIILAGYVFGGRFGFLMGSLTMLSSALITGGVGPWLPYQMFAAGWVGLSSGWLPSLQGRWAVGLLCVWGMVWGLFYGVLLNLYSWPFTFGLTAVQSGRNVWGQYAAYYLVSSLWWDVGRGLGNVLLLGVLGVPGVAALRRFERKMFFKGEKRMSNEQLVMSKGSVARTENYSLFITHYSFNNYHPLAWVVWVGCTAVLVLLARHPLYLLVLLMAVLVVRERHGYLQVFTLPLGRFAAVVLGVATLFNVLTVHIGETVLWRLPDGWPLIGGILTGEAAMYGFINGLMLVTLLALFMAFNQMVPAQSLIQYMPLALRDVGVVLLIALTYVPETQRHWERIRQAQAVRGYALRGWRDARPLLLPLLVGGLERAHYLAEAMVARGYGAMGGQSWRARLGMQVGLAVGLLAALVGAIVVLWLGWPGWLLAGAGGALVVALVWRRGLNMRVTRYRLRPWRLADSWLVLAAITPALVVAVHNAELAYNPYPALSWPVFDVLVGLALGSTAVVALLPRQKMA